MIDEIKGKFNKGKYVCDEVIRHHLVYDKIYKNSRIGMYKFHKTFIAKMIEFMAEGIVESFLVFAHYYPDLVCNDIYPILNHETDIYKSTNFALLESSSVYGSLYTKYKQFINEKMVLDSVH